MNRATCLLILICTAASAAGQTTEPSRLPIFDGRPDPGARAENAELFENRAAGVTFAVPRGMKRIAAAGDVALFVNEQQNWRLRVTQLLTEQPVRLSELRDALGRPIPGLIQNTVQRLAADYPTGTLLRADVIDIGERNVGMIAMRYRQDLRQWLFQQAIFPTDDRTFTIVTLTSPGAENADDQADDPEEVRAVTAFRALLNTVRLGDSAAVRRDQEERLYRSRWLFTTLNEAKLRQALRDETWLVLKRDGKPVGYTLIRERAGERNGDRGIEVSLRSRSFPADNQTLDSSSSLFMSFDRAREVWVSQAQLRDQTAPDRKTFAAEYGTTNTSLRGQGILEVNFQSSGAQPDPVRRPHLPPWYIPQAMGHLLPRLLPVDQPRTFMFASYISEQREVMSRYIEVSAEQDVTFDGKPVRAIVISDRVTLEGEATRHYVTRQGAYLGSENVAARVRLVVTTDAELRRLFPDFNIDRDAPTTRAGAGSRGTPVPRGGAAPLPGPR